MGSTFRTEEGKRKSKAKVQRLRFKGPSLDCCFGVSESIPSIPRVFLVIARMNLMLLRLHRQ